MGVRAFEEPPLVFLMGPLVGGPIPTAVTSPGPLSGPIPKPSKEDTSGFWLSDMMSSSWLYKLKDMGRGERSQSTRHFKKKSHASAILHPMQQLKQHDCLPSRAFCNMPTKRRTEKFHRSTINSKASDTHFPIEPPKKPKPETRRKAFRPCASAATSVSCSCRHTSTSTCKSDDSSTTFKSHLKRQETAARRSASGSHGIKQRAAATPSENLVVVKSSSDPMRDFMESMVEMIVENNIYDAKDLGELLACYLSLNSREYHEVIIKVFDHICFVLSTM
ncbi:unnamed protein product [Musa hybrid cultivar]